MHACTLLVQAKFSVRATYNANQLNAGFEGNTGEDGYSDQLFNTHRKSPPTSKILSILFQTIILVARYMYMTLYV